MLLRPLLGHDAAQQQIASCWAQRQRKRIVCLRITLEKGEPNVGLCFAQMVSQSHTLQTVLAVDMGAFLAYNVAGMSVTGASWAGITTLAHICICNSRGCLSHWVGAIAHSREAPPPWCLLACCTPGGPAPACHA